MRDLLAGQLLARVANITDSSTLDVITQRLQALASVKYDSYEGYSPGVKFLESLAVWLDGFEESDRDAALEFISNRLTYISGPEMDHLVSSVYPDILRPKLLHEAAQQMGLPTWDVARVANSNEFRIMQRTVLILGMSDGARLDKLRRASQLSTEQIHLVSQLDDAKADDMGLKLQKALSSFGYTGEAKFHSVLVVDDFSGSGTSMLRHDGEKWAGKLPKIDRHVTALEERGLVEPGAKIRILIYLLTSQAETQLNERLHDSGLGDRFELMGAYRFPATFPLTLATDAEFWDLCTRYYRTSWQNEHTDAGGGPFPHGFADCALPLVLHHNAPNNTPPIVWKDETADLADSSPSEPVWSGVFPRHERHHPGRP